MDTNHSVILGYAFGTTCLILMGFEYILSAYGLTGSPVLLSIIPVNALSQGLFKIINGQWYLIRWAFVGVATLVFYVSEASAKADWISKDISVKLSYLAAFLFAATVICFIDHIPPRLGALYLIFYPVAVLAFILTGIVVGQLFKTDSPLKMLDKIEWGFKPTKIKVENDISWHWHDKEGHIINIERPNRGTAVIGGPGSGKSYTWVEEIIRQSVQKNYTGLIYDFKFPTLTKWLHSCFIDEGSIQGQKGNDGKWLQPQSLKADRRRIWMINFADVRYSHRVNPLLPQYLKTKAHVQQYMMTTLFNLEPQWRTNRDFFVNSAGVIANASAWFFKRRYPEYCTLPHIVTFLLQPFKLIIPALRVDEETREMIEPLNVADETDAGGQLAGAFASLQNVLLKMYDERIFYILSGNDFSLDANNPENPSFICLGNNPELKETYGPVAALIATVVKGQINSPGKMPSIFCLDEAPTIFLDFADLPATARVNRVAVVVCVQDMSQLVESYGQDKADVLMGNLGNLVCGAVNNLDTAKMVSDTIGDREKENLSVNSGKSVSKDVSKTTGENLSIGRELLVKPYEITSLAVGEFVGKVAEVSEKKYDPFFKITPVVKKPNEEHAFLPILKKADGSLYSEEEAIHLVEENYALVKDEAKQTLTNVCRLAVISFGANEQKLFPQNFFQGQRIVDIYGNILPGVKGIEVSKYGEVTGSPTIIKDLDQDQVQED